MDQHSVIGVALDALALRWGSRFTILGVPDEEERQRPAVDLLVEDDMGHQLVVEHTTVESFPGRIFDDSLFVKLARCLEERLTGKLPTPGQYRVTLDPGALRRRADLDAMCAAICEWADSQAESLALGTPLTAPDHVVAGVLAPWGLEVRLMRWPHHDGRVLAVRSVPEDLIALRAKLIAKALASKCPKLKEAAAGERTSILVFESEDLALSNYADIADATIRGLEGRSDAPDVICLVETEVDADVWLIKEHGSGFPDVETPGPLPV